MANINLLKRRIRTAQNVSKTTKAMQMIAASKLKRAQEAAMLARPYVDKLTEVTQNISSRVSREKMHPYMQAQGETEKTLLIVISPDKGLCGGMISNLAKQILAYDATKKPYYINIGKKSEHTLFKLDREILATVPFGTSQPTFDVVFPIAQIIDEYYLSGKVSEVNVLSTNFVNAFTQEAKITRLLPIDMKTEGEKDETTVFEPSVDALLPTLLKHYMEMVLYQNVLESFAAEQAARMIAMKNATDNASDIITDLRLQYNKSRQEKITNEILDIGGASLYAN